MWRALSHEIRQVEQPLAARGDPFCLRNQKFVRILTRPSGLLDFRRAEVVAEPAERKPGSLRDRHDVPAVADCVTEGVHAAARIHMRLVCMSEEHPAAANRGAKYSAFHDTVPYACGGLITPSANDRGSRAEAGGSRG